MLLIVDKEKGSCYHSRWKKQGSIFFKICLFLVKTSFSRSKSSYEQIGSENQCISPEYVRVVTDCLLKIPLILITLGYNVKINKKKILYFTVIQFIISEILLVYILMQIQHCDSG